MMRVFFVIISFCLGLSLQAQKVKVAVFAPVYLDSVFEGDVYKMGKGNLPRYVISGLDFYNGVQFAADSLQQEHAEVEVLFYDSKSAKGFTEQLADSALQDVSMIIASFADREEIKPLADFALSKNILLISATYPNDGGIRNNPSFVLLNPTLNTHIEGIFGYVKKYYPLQNITLFRKKGYTEDMISNTFASLNKKPGGTPLKLRSVTLTDSFSNEEVLSYLDSNRQNVVLCGSLSESFGIALNRALASNKSYRVVAIGMPTWDGVREIGKQVEAIYSTPYNFSRTDKQGLLLTQKYRTRHGGRATEMVFKGFESVYHFTKLLLTYRDSLATHLSDKNFKLFNDFNIQPVRPTPGSTEIDYRENRKLYFVRKINGVVRSVN